MGHPADAHELLFKLAPRPGSPETQRTPAQQFLHRLPGIRPPTPEVAACYGNNRCDESVRRVGGHLKSDLRRCGTKNVKTFEVQHQASHSATPFPRGSPWEPPPPSSVVLQATEVGEGGWEVPYSLENLVGGVTQKPKVLVFMFPE